MAEKTTWIKVDRNILNWGWYKDANTFRVFMHLLLTANVKPHKFLGVDINRGELATSQKSLAEALGISIQSVRTAILHLKLTGEVTVKQHPRFAVISIPNYDLYQANQQAKRQSANSQSTGNQQQYKNTRMDINIQEERVFSPSLEEVRLYQEETGLSVDPDAFFDYYEGQGWTRGGQPIKNWKAVFRGWKDKEVYGKKKPEVSDAVRRWLEE